MEKMFTRRFSNNGIWLELIYAYATTLLILLMFRRFKLDLFEFAVNFLDTIGLLLRF